MDIGHLGTWRNKTVVSDPRFSLSEVCKKEEEEDIRPELLKLWQWPHKSDQWDETHISNWNIDQDLDCFIILTNYIQKKVVEPEKLNL